MKKSLLILATASAVLASCATTQQSMHVQLVEVDAPTWKSINDNYKTPNNTTNYIVVPQANLGYNDILSGYKYTSLFSEDLLAGSSLNIENKTQTKYATNVNTNTSATGSVTVTKEYETFDTGYKVVVQNSVTKDNIRFKIKTSADTLTPNQDATATIKNTSNSYTINAKYKDSVILTDNTLSAAKKYKVLFITTTENR